ncbi:MAG TPA: tetratricopeptide repeat protein [Allosphingosinicella sp.]|jgi:Flp pilus assembly protein TadD
MKRVALNLAASSLVLGITTVGCVTSGIGTGRAVAAQTQPRSDQQAARLNDQAARALAAGNLDEARTALEQAVALSPRDAGYRLLLADVYMKSGRFQSAEATYRDVLELDPTRPRAGIGRALMQVANGRGQDAMAQLEQLEGQAPPADLGLAFALAGSPQRAIEILEPAARAVGATARIRQNLALAYALGGDWQRSRTIAAQDVAPSELGDRMTQWASLAQRIGSGDHVATLLGVTPVQDAGQPVQLALNAPAPVPVATEAPARVSFASAEPAAVVAPIPAEAQVSTPPPAPLVAQPPVQRPVAVAFAQAQPAPAVMPAAAPSVPETAAPAPVQPIPLPAPVAFAEAQPDVPVPAPAVAAEPEAPAYAELEQPEWGLNEGGAVQLPKEESAAEQVPVRVRYAAAAEDLVRPDPVVMRVATRAARAISPIANRALRSGPRSANGRFVVQIGAFSNAGNAERAWQQAERRFGLRAEQPVTMTIDLNGRLLHRVAISGFEKRGDAARTCNSIRARGGECFVRSNAGDAAISWASRYQRRA